MATIPNSSLPFDNNVVNGDVISQTEWNQAMQAIQAAVNDNQSQLTDIPNTYYNQTQLNGGQLDSRYYTQTQVDTKLNNATYTDTVQAVTAFPTSANDGQIVYRTDLKTVYVYDSASATWIPTAGQASTTNPGTVEVSTAPTAGQTPVAVATTDPVYINTARTDQVNTFTGNQTAPALVSSGLTGATAASRYVGATTSGAPTAGTFAVGDFIVDQTGSFWVCITAGTPGTWIEIPKPAKHQVRISLLRGSTGTASTTNTPTSQLYFAFHASEWSSSTFYGEFVGSLSGTATGYFGIWDLTASAPVSGSEVSTTATSVTLLPRTGALTLIDGHNYAAYWRSSDSSVTVDIDAADLLQLL